MANGTARKWAEAKLATWTISTALVWRHAAARQQPLLRARLGYDLLLWALLLPPVERALYGSAHPAYRRTTRDRTYE